MSGRFFNPEINLLCCEYLTLQYWEYVRMAAPFWRIYHNDNPGAEITWQERRIKLSPDSIFLIAPETAMNSFLQAPSRHLYIHFTAQCPYDLPAPGIYKFPFTSPERDIIEQIKKSIKSDRMGLPALALATLMLARVPTESLETPISDKRILKTVKYIKEHYREKIPNDRLANIAAMNTNAFIRLFSQHTGIPPQQYITEYRLRQACLRLQYSDDSIDEIAEHTGFCNRFYFTKQFTRHRKIGPARFRIMARAGIE